MEKIIDLFMSRNTHVDVNQYIAVYKNVLVKYKNV